jgi:glycosyltransferase involved in cell wall biosynthesis
MVKLFLSIDDYIYYSGVNYYMDASSSENMLSRYLSIFDEVNVLARIINKPIDVAGYQLIKNANKLHIIEIPYSNRFRLLAKYFIIKFKIRRSLKHVDLAIIRMPSMLGLVTLSKVIKAKLPYALEIVADPEFVLNRSKRPLKSIIASYLAKKMKYYSLHALGVSYVTEFYLQTKYPPKVNAITANYSSIELKDDFFYTPKRFEKKDQFNIIHISFKITSPGKGQEILLKVAKIVIDRGIRLKIFILGTGAYVKTLEKLASDLGISEQINFLGYLGKYEVKRLLRESDLMIFPSFSEGLPRTVIEACASGLPCVASNVGGIPEILSNDVIFDPTDINGIAEKTIEILNNPEYYELLSKMNYEKSWEYHQSNLEKKRDEFYLKLKNRII